MELESEKKIGGNHAFFRDIEANIIGKTCKSNINIIMVCFFKLKLRYIRKYVVTPTFLFGFQQPLLRTAFPGESESRVLEGTILKKPECLLLYRDAQNVCTVARYEQGWCSGESTRLLPMWPWFDSRTRRQMWVEFVVGSRPCSRVVFLLVLRFSPLHKNQHFRIPIRSGIRGPQVCQSSDC